MLATSVTWRRTSILKKWYPNKGGRYAEGKLAANYPHRQGPVGLGWLKSPHEGTRLVAADTLARANARWALPDLLQVLDDPYLINRRFTQVRLSEMLKMDLRKFGYRFYQTKAERQTPLKKVRGEVLPGENNRATTPTPTTTR
jgi:hypothetical protein